MCGHISVQINTFFWTVNRIQLREAQPIPTQKVQVRLVYRPCTQGSRATGSIPVASKRKSLYCTSTFSVRGMCADWSLAPFTVARACSPLPLPPAFTLALIPPYPPPFPQRDTPRHLHNKKTRIISNGRNSVHLESSKKERKPSGPRWSGNWVGPETTLACKRRVGGRLGRLV